MILFRENGRLGNQIFQYCGLRTLAEQNERLVLFGFEPLQAVFTGIHAEIINGEVPKYKRSFYFRLYNYANKLSDKAILPLITENEKREIVNTDYIFNNIKVARDLFLQSASNFNSSFAKDLNIREPLLNKTKNILTSISGKSDHLVFVHVRRGDYAHWPDPDYPAILSSDYYREAISIIKGNVAAPFFIFTSDEPDFVRNEFSDIHPKYISNNNVDVDFAIMSQCQAGILSASSLSWWAAFFINIQNQKPLLIAPKYWGGHRIKKWYPPKIKTDFLMYIDVNQ